MTDILFLTVRMVSGFGVDLVVANLAKQFRERDINCTVACLDQDGTYGDVDIYEIPDRLSALQKLADLLQPQLIIAHTNPFFNFLPQLKTRARIMAWEHGDPDPKLLPERAGLTISAEKQHKLTNVYPKCEKVIAISKFIRRDIAWPAAEVIYNGCDHIPDIGPKRSVTKGVLHIGMLNRLGQSENMYKGTKYYLELSEILRSKKIPCEIHFMGRGTEQDAEKLKTAGFTVHLNATEEEKILFYREMDIFVTTSLWEGFNLPLVEAQASGTLGMALRTAVHAEVTPYAFANIAAMARAIAQLANNRRELLAASEKCYRFVRRQFLWRSSTEQFLRIAAFTPTANRDVKFWKAEIYRRWFRACRFMERARSLGLKRVLRGIVRRVFGQRRL